MATSTITRLIEKMENLVDSCVCFSIAHQLDPSRACHRPSIQFLLAYLLDQKWPGGRPYRLIMDPNGTVFEVNQDNSAVPIGGESALQGLFRETADRFGLSPRERDYLLSLPRIERIR